VRVSPDQLDRHLERNLGNFYLIFGDEPLLAQEASDAIRTRARAAGFAERKIFVVDTGFDWAALLAERDSFSLFAENRILDIRLPTGKPGKEGAEALQTYVSRLPDLALTLVTLPGMDRAGQASKWFQALDACGTTVEARPVTRDQLPRWLRSRLAAQKQDADTDVLEFLASRVEGNLLAAHQEIQKLGLLLEPGKLALADVKPAVLDVARYDVFALGPALLSADQVQFVRVLEGLRGEGVAPPLILWALAEEMRAIGRVLNLVEQGQPLAQAMRDARVWGPRQNLMPQAIRRVNRDMLRRGLDHASTIDRQIKGLLKGDVWDELLQLGLALIRRPGAKTRDNRGRISAH
jgi:DNA polymerase-3 subunit delta